MNRELKNRILFGALFSILALLAILAPLNHIFFLLVVVLLLFMNYEYIQIAAAMGKALRPLLIYAPFLLLAAFWFYQLNLMHKSPPFWLVLVWALLFVTLFLIPRRHKVFFYGLNLLWIWLPCFFLLALYQMEQGKSYILFLVLVVIASDIFSYFGGKTFGKHKLAPAISPGKTWEGSLARLYRRAVRRCDLPPLFPVLFFACWSWGDRRAHFACSNWRSV